MNTFWLKLAAGAVAIVIAVVLIGMLTGGEPQPKEPLTGFSDQVRKDREELNAQPQFKEPTVPDVVTQQPTPHTQQPSLQQPTQTIATEPQFEKLSREEEFEAQKLWEWVVNQRSMGRLPVMGYGQMVKACRDIISRWPNSEYAFKAKRALADLPERYRKMYSITDEEIDLGNLK